MGCPTINLTLSEKWKKKVSVSFIKSKNILKLQEMNGSIVNSDPVE